MKCEITQPRNWAKLYAANQTSTSFAAAPPTTTQPYTTNTGGSKGVRTVTEGFIPVEGDEILELAFFGAGSDNQTFDARVYGWRQVGTAVSGAGPQWIPTALVDVNCTLCGQVGTAGFPLVNTDRVVDTVTVVANAGIAVTKGVQAEETMTELAVAIDGYEYVQVVFDMTGATNGNCLWAKY